jgi:hypothetical protein
LRSALRSSALAAVAVALALTACEPSAPPKPVVHSRHGAGLMADDIPVAHTPPGGWGVTFPKPVLAGCTEPLVAGAPDLRGIWKIMTIERYGKPLPKGDPMYAYAERIEQCGNRIVDMGHGQIADARADGTVANAVHEVSAFDYKTRIVAVASYEDGVFVLRPLPVIWIPVTLPWLKVTRQLDTHGHMIWIRPDLGHQHAVLKRIGGPNDGYTIH